MPSPPPAEPPLPAALLPLLRGVSRSFYLSIRLLPAPLRAPVAVGYLLARATDTVADTAELPVARRTEVLEALADWLAHGSAAQRAHSEGGDASRAHSESGDARRARAIEQARAFAQHQPAGPERDLMLALPACADALDALPTADRADVRDLLRHITRGQLLDVQRFGAATRDSPVQLASALELDEYTWLVAGSVGAFWTRLAHRHLPGAMSLSLETMLTLALSYGKGLQLVNILRDAEADAAQGRRYLPLAHPEPFYWKVRAALGMEDGLRYAMALRHRRLRVASALPALLGIRTIRLMRDATPGTTVKVPRDEVRHVMLRTALSLGGRGTLRALFERLGAGWDARPATDNRSP